MTLNLNVEYGVRYLNDIPGKRLYDSKLLIAYLDDVLVLRPVCLPFFSAMDFRRKQLA